MRRRVFLARSVTVAGVLAARSILAKPGETAARAAVVIGVDKCGNLPVLRAAGSGARSVAEWLAGEEFEVKLFVDDQRPVTAKAIFDAIDGLLSKGTLQQLVIYFSGHGFITAPRSEVWMLSGAPHNPNEAVSLLESLELARETAIPSISFISDACRSTPDSLGAQRVQGSMIFPSKSDSPVVRPEVGRFRASSYRHRK